MTDLTYPVVINTALLEEHGACDEGLAEFLAACPTGELVIPDAAAHLAALSGPLAEWERWAIAEGILPRLVMTAGYEGTATAGDYGTAVAGDYGTATAGHRGTATAGDRGTATAGDWGTATAGREGAASAGYGGLLVLRWWDEEANRLRIAVAYVGEHAPGLPNGEVIQPYVPYRVEVVEGRPMWRRAAGLILDSIETP